MRGAQPDAVCPRCEHHQPPSETQLSHCAQCGLTFQPKEILVRTKRPPIEEEEVFDAALVVVPPKSLTVATAGDELTYQWTEHPDLRRTVLMICVALGAVLWASDAALNDKIGGLIVLCVLAVAAVFQSQPSVKLRVGKHHLFSGRGMLLLSDVKSVELTGSRLFAVKRDDKRELILSTSDREIAAYLRNTLAKRFEPENDKRPEPEDPRR